MRLARKISKKIIYEQKNSNKMKKIILSGAALLAIAAGAVFNVNLNSQSNKLSAVSLANVEALAGFEFNGTDWDTDDHWYNNIGSNWKPVLIACTASSGSSTFTVSTGGSANILGTGLSWNGMSYTYNGGTTSYNGAQVQCQGGSGNCYSGTSCMGASII
ncbi:hypothetical protein AGMMS50239_12430 [Bacteroidia bacterium]|nr:hypothetical protein AGMMS50239_12430 [Bacteroidia bacterium]